MYLDHPAITATNSDSEPDRIERLNRVYGYVVGMAEAVGNVELVGKLVQLHDHKGVLSVFWRKAPAPAEKVFFHQAWKSLIGDGSVSVQHEVKDAAE